MKAKEYYEKYKDGLSSDEKEVYVLAAQEFLVEMFKEVDAIIKMRHIQYDKGAIPVLREQNDKYKAIVRMFEKEYGASPLKQDGFETLLEREMPGVVARMKEKRGRF